MARLMDLIGQRFGRLVVTGRAGTAVSRHASWGVRCDCGVVKTVESRSLRTGNTRSCGCLRVEMSSERALHGVSETPEYFALRDARRRCTNPSDRAFKDYGGRGIEYRLPTDIGEAVLLLVDVIGLRPSKSYSIDRIDNEGHYEIGNLRWATRHEQRQNQRGAA